MGIKYYDQVSGQPRGLKMLNSYWVRLIGTVALLVAVYFIISPYQGCMRNTEGGPVRCSQFYSW